MIPITADESQLVMSILTKHVNWRKIDFVESGLKEIINNPEKAGRQLALFLKNGGRVVVGNGAFPVWKTIKHGVKGFQTAKDFRKALKKAGFKIDEWGNDILGKAAYRVSAEEIEVSLVVVSNVELGFNELGISMEDTYIRAQDLGLELCQPEDALLLRLEYPDQSKGYDKGLIIATEPIINSYSRPEVFYLYYDYRGRSIGSCKGDPDRRWSGDCRFVFRFKEQSLLWNAG